MLLLTVSCRLSLVSSVRRDRQDLTSCRPDQRMQTFSQLWTASFPQFAACRRTDQVARCPTSPPLQYARLAQHHTYALTMGGHGGFREYLFPDGRTRADSPRVESVKVRQVSIRPFRLREIGGGCVAEWASGRVREMTEIWCGTTEELSGGVLEANSRRVRHGPKTRRMPKVPSLRTTRGPRV